MRKINKTMKIYEDILDDLDALQSNAAKKVADVPEEDDDAIIPSAEDYEYMMAIDVNSIIGSYTRNFNLEWERLLDRIEYVLHHVRHISDVSRLYFVSCHRAFADANSELFTYISRDDMMSMMDTEEFLIDTPKIYVAFNADFRTVRQIIAFTQALMFISKGIKKFWPIFYRRNKNWEF